MQRLGNIQGDSVAEDFLQKQKPFEFRSVEIYSMAEDDFEIILGTQDGEIYHARFETNVRGVEFQEPYTHFHLVQDIPEVKAILDIKVVKIEEQSRDSLIGAPRSLGASMLILVLTETSIYQFLAESDIADAFKIDHETLIKNKIMLDGSIQFIDQSKEVSEQMDDVLAQNCYQLKIYYD